MSPRTGWGCVEVAAYLAGRWFREPVPYNSFAGAVVSPRTGGGVRNLKTETRPHSAQKSRIPPQTHDLSPTPGQRKRLPCNYFAGEVGESPNRVGVRWSLRSPVVGRDHVLQTSGLCRGPSSGTRQDDTENVSRSSKHAPLQVPDTPTSARRLAGPPPQSSGGGRGGTNRAGVSGTSESMPDENPSRKAHVPSSDFQNSSRPTYRPSKRVLVLKAARSMPAGLK